MNLVPITTQQVVDTIHSHFFEKENPPGLDGEGRCTYLGPDGSRCAVGCLMPEALIRCEGNIVAGSITGVIREYPYIREFFSKVDIHLLQSIQSAHDSAAGRARQPYADDPGAYFRSLFLTGLREIFKWNAHDVVLPEVFK